MAERIATIILLVEDINQENLLRRYLQRCGHENRTMRIVKSLPGQGSGEQYVREQYASQVHAIRAHMARTKAWLIVMIDADTGSVDLRRQQLDRALRDADKEPRGASEPILHLIPKRNVETWILCLNSIDVDEVTDYRHDRRVGAESIKRAARILFDWTRPNSPLPGSCVPSLEACHSEFRRLPPVTL